MSVNIVTIHKHNNNYSIFNCLESFEKLEIFEKFFSFLSEDCMLETKFEDHICLRNKIDDTILEKEKPQFPNLNYYIATREGCQIFVSHKYLLIFYPVKIQFIENTRYLDEIKKVCLNLNKLIEAKSFILLFDSNRLIYDSFFKKNIIKEHKLKIMNIKSFSDLANFNDLDTDEDIFIG